MDPWEKEGQEVRTICHLPPLALPSALIFIGLPTPRCSTRTLGTTASTVIVKHAYCVFHPAASFADLLRLLFLPSTRSSLLAFFSSSSFSIAPHKPPFILVTLNLSSSETLIPLQPQTNFPIPSHHSCKQHWSSPPPFLFSLHAKHVIPP